MGAIGTDCDNSTGQCRYVHAYGICEYEMFSVCNCTVVEMATQEETAVSVKIHTIGMVVNVFHVTATLMEARILTVIQPLVNVLVRYVSMKDNFCH